MSILASDVLIDEEGIRQIIEEVFRERIRHVGKNEYVMLGLPADTINALAEKLLSSLGIKEEEADG